MCQVLLFDTVYQTHYGFTLIFVLSSRNVAQSTGSAEQIVLPWNSLLARTGEYLTYEMILGEKNSAKTGINWGNQMVFSW